MTPMQNSHPNWQPLIDHLKSGVIGVNANGYPDKDFEHYTFEIAMECLFGPNVWAWWNSKANY